MSKNFTQFTEAAAAAPVAAAGKVAVGVAKGVGKATITAGKALGKAAASGIKAGVKTAGQTVAVAGGEAAASVVRAAGEGTAQRVKKKFAGESYEATKKKEVLGAMKRQGRKLSDKDKNKIADKVVKDKGDTSKSDDRYAYEGYDVEDAVEYFYEEGVTEEELDMIIEEVGDDIVDFIDEERKARKMNVRSKGKLKKDVAKIKANKSDVVPRKTSPKDALNRAASARVFGKKKLKRPESTVTKATKKAKTAPKKAAPKAKAKPTPKKKASKEGIRSKIGKAYKKGVERHKAAVKKNKFASGVKAGVKAVGKAAKDVHSITQVNKSKTVNMQSYEPEGELVEGDVHSGQGEKIQKRTKAWMDKKGQKGAPGLDAMKARAAEHKAKRGVKEEVVDEGVGTQVKKGLKRHKDAVEKKKIKDRKAVPYAALAAEHQPEGEMVEELSRRSKPSAKAKMAKLDAVLKRREERKVKEKEALKTEGWLGKKKEEKKPQKAMDAGARAKRKLQRKEYAAKVSGSEDNVPDEMREDSDSRVKALQKIKKDRLDRAKEPMTTDKILKKKKSETCDPTPTKAPSAPSAKPIVAEFVNNLWEATKCPKCGKKPHRGACKTEC